MTVAVASSPKKGRKSGVPSYLLYETLNGRALYYRGYRDVTTEKKHPPKL